MGITKLFHYYHKNSIYQMHYNMKIIYQIKHLKIKQSKELTNEI